MNKADADLLKYVSQICLRIKNPPPQEIFNLLPTKFRNTKNSKEVISKIKKLLEKNPNILKKEKLTPQEIEEIFLQDITKKIPSDSFVKVDTAFDWMIKYDQQVLSKYGRITFLKYLKDSPYFEWKGNSIKLKLQEETDEEIDKEEEEDELSEFFSLSFKFDLYSYSNVVPMEIACAKIDYDTGIILSTFHEFIDMEKPKSNVDSRISHNKEFIHGIDSSKIKTNSLKSIWEEFLQFIDFEKNPKNLLFSLNLSESLDCIASITTNLRIRNELKVIGLSDLLIDDISSSKSNLDLSSQVLKFCDCKDKCLYHHSINPLFECALEDACSISGFIQKGIEVGFDHFLSLEKYYRPSMNYLNQSGELKKINIDQFKKACEFMMHRLNYLNYNDICNQMIVFLNHDQYAPLIMEVLFESRNSTEIFKKLLSDISKKHPSFGKQIIDLCGSTSENVPFFFPKTNETFEFDENEEFILFDEQFKKINLKESKETKELIELKETPKEDEIIELKDQLNIEREKLNTEDEVLVLLKHLPQKYYDILIQLNLSNLVEIEMDFNRIPKAHFFKSKFVKISDDLVTMEDIQFVVEKLNILPNNRSGIEKYLHRISVIKSLEDVIIGITLRVGKPIYGISLALKDILDSKKSILFLGAPGCGKTSKN
jgi:hypothetical protein